MEEPFDFIKVILESVPESQRLQAVDSQDVNGDTILHIVVSDEGKLDFIQVILEAIPESLRLQAVNTQDRNGRTAVLDIASKIAHESIMQLLPKMTNEVNSCWLRSSIRRITCVWHE